MSSLEAIALLGMALKASNVVGNPGSGEFLLWKEELTIWFSVREETAAVCLWPSTTKQGSGVGHTLNASFMSLLALDKSTGIRGWAYLKCILGGMAIIKASSSRLMRRS
jgi:hypothetical protein